MEMKNAVTIVTGSATGIGAACAIESARLGSRVVINYTRSEKEARETQQACEKLGVETLLVQADVASNEDCLKLANAALEKWGRIDGLVNNAGITKFAPNHRDQRAAALSLTAWLGVVMAGRWIAYADYLFPPE